MEEILYARLDKIPSRQNEAGFSNKKWGSGMHKDPP